MPSPTWTRRIVIDVEVAQRRDDSLFNAVCVLLERYTTDSNFNVTMGPAPKSAAKSLPHEVKP